MRTDRSTFLLRPALAALFGVVLAVLLAPTDLISTRGAVLRGMVGQYCQAGASLEVHATGEFGDNPSLDVLATTNSTPVTATLADASGNPIAGETITFTTDTGGFDDGSGGTVTPITATTDASGHATVTLVIGQFSNDVTVNITAAWCTLLATRALPWIADIWPAGSRQLQSNPGNAAYTSGRTVPVTFTVLNPVAPPAPAANADYNWPPVPNLKLVAKVGTLNAGAPAVNAAYGSIDQGNVITDANGQVNITYTPPNANPAAGADPKTAVVWLEDRRGVAVTSTINLWGPGKTDAVDCPNVGAVYTNARMNYKNSVNDAGLNAIFQGKITEWGGLRDGANKAHFTFTAVANPQISTPRGFEAISTYPVTLADRARSASAYGSAGTVANAYNQVNFYMENLKPQPQFTAFPATPTGLENVIRTFDPTIPDDGLRSISSHEIAHLLGLAHTTSTDAQLSIMCHGRGGTSYGGIFRWFVNGVQSPSTRDQNIVLTTIYPAAL